MTGNRKKCVKKVPKFAFSPLFGGGGLHLVYDEFMMHPGLNGYGSSSDDEVKEEITISLPLKKKRRTYENREEHKMKFQGQKSGLPDSIQI